MSTFQLSKEQANQNKQWQLKYLQNVPLDTGITSPEGYNIHADPAPPYICSFII